MKNRRLPLLRFISCWACQKCLKKKNTVHLIVGLHTDPCDHQKKKQTHTKWGTLHTIERL
jgi:hypothetical protein